MDRTTFFAHLRGRNSGVFGTSLTQAQVEGVSAVLDAGSHLPPSHLAYALATAYHETGARMRPVTENLTYTSAARIRQVWPSRLATDAAAAPYVRNPEGLANLVYGGRLGNAQPGDGWRFRGRGLVQLTGRVNYERIRDLTGVDVVANPDLALRTDLSARALIAGIEHGIYTGRRAADYLPGDYVQARRIINADVAANGAKIAGYARAFDAALTAAGYVPAAKVRPPAPPIPQLPGRNPLAALLAAIINLFRRSK